MLRNNKKSISEIAHTTCYIENPQKNYLHRIITIIEKALKVNITYINMNRYTAVDPRLNILFKNAIHSSNYCLFIKENKKGQQYCYICKSKGIKKCLAFRNGFNGMCIMGVHDIVKPVFIKDEIYGILYLSGIRFIDEEHKAKILIKKHCKTFGRSESEMISEYMKLTPVDSEKMKVMEECLEELREIIIYIIKTMKPLSATKKEFSAESDESMTEEKWIYNSILPFIKENYKSNITLEKLAEIFFMNPSYLCRTFKLKVGVNFKQYITQLKIEEAKDKLIRTDSSITEIAISSGFNDPNYFSRVFKKNVGMTPSEYRTLAGI